MGAFFVFPLLLEIGEKKSLKTVPQVKWIQRFSQKPILIIDYIFRIRTLFNVRGASLSYSLNAHREGRKSNSAARRKHVYE